MSAETKRKEMKLIKQLKKAQKTREKNGKNHTPLKSKEIEKFRRILNLSTDKDRKKYIDLWFHIHNDLLFIVNKYELHSFAPPLILSFMDNEECLDGFICLDTKPIIFSSMFGRTTEKEAAKDLKISLNDTVHRIEVRRYADDCMVKIFQPKPVFDGLWCPGFMNDTLSRIQMNLNQDIIIVIGLKLEKQPKTRMKNLDHVRCAIGLAKNGQCLKNAIILRTFKNSYLEIFDVSEIHVFVRENVKIQNANITITANDKLTNIVLNNENTPMFAKNDNKNNNNNNNDTSFQCKNEILPIYENDNNPSFGIANVSNINNNNNMNEAQIVLNCQNTPIPSTTTRIKKQCYPHPLPLELPLYPILNNDNNNNMNNYNPLNDITNTINTESATSNTMTNPFMMSVSSESSLYSPQIATTHNGHSPHSIYPNMIPLPTIPPIPHFNLFTNSSFEDLQKQKLSNFLCIL